MSIQSCITGIPDLAWKIGAIAIVSTIAIAGALEYRQSLINYGVKIESNRRDGLASGALIETNNKVAAGQLKIQALQAQLSTLQGDFNEQQKASAVRESNLRSGNERMRVQLAAHRNGEGQQSGSSAIANVDNGPAIVEDLDPQVAGNLESLRRNENAAIDRLDACIIAYDKVREQVNSLK